jgi:hypothetical protein
MNCATDPTSEKLQKNPVLYLKRKWEKRDGAQAPTVQFHNIRGDIGWPNKFQLN